MIKKITFFNLLLINFVYSLTISNSEFLTSKPLLSSQSLTLESSKLVNMDFKNTISETLTISEAKSSSTTVIKRIIGNVLNYPNPVKKGANTFIGYKLSTAMPIEILIYDSTGYLIFKTNFSSNQLNASKGEGFYNKVNLRNAGFNTENFSTGIYFYIVLSEGKVLGKGKLAIIP